MSDASVDQFGSGLRVAWVIALKDILDGVRNKTTLAVLIPTLLMVFVYRFLPVWSSRDEPTRVYLYDQGNSGLLDALDTSLALRVYDHASQDEMERNVAGADLPELGLAVPADLEGVLARGESAVIDGYAPHWVSTADAERAALLLEDEIAETYGGDIEVRVNDRRVYPDASSGGYAYLTSITLMYVITVVGVTLVPHLMIEEKQARTLDALLVSPANYVQVVMGKAGAGLFYVLLGVALVFGVNWVLVTHWALALATTLCATLLAVSLGLVLGTALEVKQQLQIWAWLLLVPMLFSLFIAQMSDLFPEWIAKVAHWTPTAALARAYRMSFSANPTLSEYGLELGLAIVVTAVALGIVGWLLRRKAA